MGFFSTLFGSSSIVDGVTDVAKEWIETSKEKEEAKAVMIKALDPNGLMRRNISAKISSMYVIYVVLVMILTLMQSFGIGDVEGTKQAIDSLKDLFVPITTMFTAIVGASFGVNGLNAHKGV